VSEVQSAKPVVDGWFTVDDEPRLIGSRCPLCGTIVFPPRDGACPNPACDSTELTRVPLSRRGRVWSYTENHYPPPSPYVAADPFEPYALAAVELPDEGLVVLGQVSKGVRAADLRVGMEMQVAIEVLSHDDDHDSLVYVWEPVAATESGEA
jgi:uncharacterized OB-fold protein